MDDFSYEEQPGSRRKAIIIGAAIAGVVLIGVGIAFLLWRRAQGPIDVIPPGQNVNVNQPATNQPVANVNRPILTDEELAAKYPMKPQAVNAPLPKPEPVEAGLDRQMTAEEKKKYGFLPNQDVRIITSKPTDGSRPHVSFSLRTPPLTSAPDQDRDGLSDSEEKQLGTDPSKVDTDGDTIGDYDEVNGDHDGNKTDPLKTDTDGDGKSDDAEHGGFPNDPTQ